MDQIRYYAVADPGFPRRGHQSLGLEQKPIIWQDFLPKTA